MIYLVLGMHKSGTTLVAQMLHKSGINMVESCDDISYDSGNKSERESTKKINKYILGCGDSISINVKEDLNIDSVKDVFFQEGRDLINQLNNEYLDWGFKDPRTCLTYSFWKKVLHTNPYKIIFVYRNPAEVYKHYCKTVNATFFKGKKRKWKLGIESLRCWYKYNFNCFSILKNSNVTNSCVFIDYSSLLKNPQEKEKLDKFVGKTLVNVIEPKLYRSHSDNSLQYSLTLDICKYLFKEDVAKLHKLLRILDEKITKKYN